MNAQKLIDHIIKIIEMVKPLKTSAFKVIPTILHQNGEPLLLLPKPPDYFRVCSVLRCDVDNMNIALEMPYWPVALTADGYSTNIDATKKMGNPRTCKA